MNAERWFLCRVTEKVVVADEPDWSRVPEERRDAVQARWRAANEQTEISEVRLWGPQIEFFQRQYRVEVIE